MRVAITGGSGFIGTNLMLYLAETEPDTEIVIVDIAPPRATLPANARYVYADIRNLASLLRVFEGCGEVYHLAGVLGTSELIAVSSLACETNVVGANNVMDACRLAGVKRIYNVAKPHFDGYSENAYTLTKHAGELVGRLYQDKYGMEVATVRWLNAVGPHQHLYPVRKFLPMMILCCMFDDDLQVYGDGTQTIDPIDVVDLSRFTVHACRNLGAEAKVVDLGSGRAINCNDGARLILDIYRSIAPTRSKVVNVPMRDGEKPGVNLVADMSYWDSVGMEAEVSFEESIAKTIGYMFGLPPYELTNARKFYRGA
jgi:nucleoside-diphosphate-sugar epimerase